METKTNIYGTINEKELSNDLVMVSSQVPLEKVKLEFTRKLFNDAKLLLKDNKRYLEKNPEKKGFVDEINKFIIEQFKKTNMYKVTNTTSTTNELEIIELNNKEEEIKELERMIEHE